MAQPEFERFVTACRHARQTAAPVDELRRLLLRTVAPEAPAWRTWLPPLTGTETLHHVDDELTIVEIELPSEVRYPPHDHGMEAVIVVRSGVERHHFYVLEGGRLVERGFRDIGPGEVLTTGIGAIHAVRNVAPSPSSALHVYLGNLPRVERSLWDPTTEAPQPFADEAYFALAQPTS